MGSHIHGLDDPAFKKCDAVVQYDRHTRTFAILKIDTLQFVKIFPAPVSKAPKKVRGCGNM